MAVDEIEGLSGIRLRHLLLSIAARVSLRRGRESWMRLSAAGPRRRPKAPRLAAATRRLENRGTGPRPAGASLRGPVPPSPAPGLPESDARFSPFRRGPFRGW